MSWLVKAVSVLFGGSGGIVQPIADVYKAKAVAEGEQATAAADDATSARQFAAPIAGTGNGLFNDLVDGANRLVRPVVSFYLLGGLARWWVLPELSIVDPRWVAAGSVVLTFWFGGRMLLKDLPQGMAAAMALYSRLKNR